MMTICYVTPMVFSWKRVEGPLWVREESLLKCGGIWGLVYK